MSQYGQLEKGVVYPNGELSLNLTLTNKTNSTLMSQDNPCTNVTAADTNCTVTLPRGVYIITVTQSNDNGSTVDSSLFDSKCIAL